MPFTVSEDVSIVTPLVAPPLPVIASAAMGAAPCDQLGYVVVGDLGEQFGRSKIGDQSGEIALGGVGADMKLSDLQPVAGGDVVDLQRLLSLAGFDRKLFRFFPLELFYAFCFSLIRRAR